MLKLKARYQVLGLVVILPLIFNNCNTQLKKTEDKQNILLIVVDDMNDWAGLFD